MIDACAVLVSEAEVTELMKEVRLFRTDVLAWLEKNHPDLHENITT